MFAIVQLYCQMSPMKAGEVGALTVSKMMKPAKICDINKPLVPLVANAQVVEGTVTISKIIKYEV